MKRISSVSMRKLISGLSEMLGGTANLRSRVGRIRFLRARDPGCIASFAGESFSFGQGLPRGAPTKNIANKLYCGFRFRRFGAPRVFSAFRKNNRGKKDFPCPVLPAIFFPPRFHGCQPGRVHYHFFRAEMRIPGSLMSSRPSLTSTKDPNLSRPLRDGRVGQF